MLSVVNWYFNGESKTYLCNSDKAGFLATKSMIRLNVGLLMWGFYFPHRKHISAIWRHRLSTNSGDSCGHKLCFTHSGFVMPRARKVRRVHLVIGSSVCPTVRLSVRYSVPLTNNMQYLKFGWWYSNQTWTVTPSIGSSHFNDITRPWGWGWVKM